MPKERKATPLSGFFKFTEKGQAVAGTLKGIFAGIEDSTFAVLSPVIVYNGKGKKGKMWLSASIQMSADLRAKIDPDRKGDDNGKNFTVTYVSTEPSTKGSPKKVFRVEELEVAEIRELARDADASDRQKPFPKPERVEESHDEPEPDEAETADDDMPF